MDPHARAFAFLARRIIPDDLVVSDSEPEANLQSTTTKASASTVQNQTRGRGPDRFSATRSIIEISDDSSRRLPRPAIIELTDDSESEEEIQITAQSRVLPTTRPVTQPQPPPLPVPGVPGSRFSFGALVSNGGGSDSETPSIDLSQFVYSAQPSRPKSRAASHSSVRSINSAHSVRSVLPEKPSNVRMVHSVADFLTDREIGLLSRCVSCDIAWTTNKTVSKKRYHLRICQKKNDLTDNTIRMRMERELGKAEEENAQEKGKGKAKEKSVSPQKPATLMDAVVHDALPKKRAKRKEKAPTIIGIQHQHETIQEQARRLLALSSDEEDSSPPGLPATTSTTVPLTQQFPLSKLGVRKNFEVSMAASLPSPVASDEDEKPISISSDSESRVSDEFSHLFSHGSGRHRDPQNVLRQSLTLHNGEDEWMKELQREIDNRESTVQWDDAGVFDTWHWEPHMTDVVGKGVTEDDIMHVDSIETKKKHIRKPKVPSAQSLATPLKGRPANRPPSTASSPVKGTVDANIDGRTSPTKAQSLGASEALEQENFNNLMQEAIMNNKALWQRILRYEPVNFTEFLDIALATGESSRKLTDKLRVFLVSKAIQVFTPKPKKRR